MLPLTTTTADIDRPVPNADYDEPATLQRLYTALSGHLSSPFGAGNFAAGQQEAVDAVYLANITDPELAIGDVLTLANGDAYRATWCRRRHGNGLDHQVVGLRAVKGGVV